MSYLTEEQRKEKISHMCNYFTFKSCADLSEGVTATPIVPDKSTETISPDIIAKDVACFTAWWMHTFHSKLNGFSGLDTIKWKF